MKLINILSFGVCLIPSQRVQRARANLIGPLIYLLLGLKRIATSYTYLGPLVDADRVTYPRTVEAWVASSAPGICAG